MSDYWSSNVDYGPLFRTSDRPTSKAAGADAREFLGEHDRKILAALALGPGNKDEIAARCDLNEQKVIRRIAWLVRRGMVADTGITRSTASGRMATVWRKA